MHKYLQCLTVHVILTTIAIKMFKTAEFYGEEKDELYNMTF